MIGKNGRKSTPALQLEVRNSVQRHRVWVSKNLAAKLKSFCASILCPQCKMLKRDDRSISCFPRFSNYCCNAGVQIHSWGKAWGDDTPNLEYVQPCVVYTVVNGEKTALDMNKIPALTPRQIKELAAARGELSSDAVSLSQDTCPSDRLGQHMKLSWDPISRPYNDCLM